MSMLECSRFVDNNLKNDISHKYNRFKKLRKIPMFVSESTKNFVFTTISGMLVVCIFSAIGCTVNKISEKDIQLIDNHIKMKMLERQNALLVKENERLREENKQLRASIANYITPTSDNTEPARKNEESKGNIPDLDSEVNLQPSQEGKQPSSRRFDFSPDRKFRVGDKLPDFAYSSVAWQGPIISICFNNVGSKPVFPSKTTKTIVIKNSTHNESINIASLKKSTPILWIENSTFNGVEYNIIHFKEGKSIELKNGSRYICETSKGCTIDLTNLAVVEGEITVSYKK